MRKKISVNNLSDDQFEKIMNNVAKKKNIPIIKSEQVNMRLTKDMVFIAQKLAQRAKLPMTTFLTELLSEDLRRMWKVAK